MAYLFDTDALSEVLKPGPAAAYVDWLQTVPRSDQFTSAVVIGELFSGAFRSADAGRHLEDGAGRVLADADLQIAATALQHDLELVTGNLRHFERGAGPGPAVGLALARRGPPRPRPDAN